MEDRKLKFMVCRVEMKNENQQVHWRVERFSHPNLVSSPRGSSDVCVNYSANLLLPSFPYPALLFSNDISFHCSCYSMPAMKSHPQTSSSTTKTFQSRLRSDMTNLTIIPLMSQSSSLRFSTIIAALDAIN